MAYIQAVVNIDSPDYVERMPDFQPFAGPEPQLVRVTPFDDRPGFVVTVIWWMRSADDLIQELDQALLENFSDLGYKAHYLVLE